MFLTKSLTPSSQVSAIPNVVTNGTGCADKTAKAKAKATVSISAFYMI